MSVPTIPILLIRQRPSYHHEGNWKILPHQKTARWELQQVEDRWLLLVGGVAQVNLHPAEALVFLKRRWLSSLKREAV
jgi:hypothetical protein